VRTSFLPGLALWSLFPRPQSHGPTFWTVFYGKRLVNSVTVEVGTMSHFSDFATLPANRCPFSGCRECGGFDGETWSS
jgi:hypothetical protein